MCILLGNENNTLGEYPITQNDLIMYYKKVYFFYVEYIHLYTFKCICKTRVKKNNNNDHFWV